jgi:putative NIF3 family GTP cyclohydrolase 1 type 2
MKFFKVMTRIYFLLLILISSTIFFGFSCKKSITAGEVISRIQKHVQMPWQSKTVDTYKGGNENIEITGIASTFLATLDVLKKAHEKGLNMVITHEPTFYNHFDNIDEYGDSDPIVQDKMNFIKKNNMVVFRFHDHIHKMEHDGIYAGVVQKLGWDGYEKSRRPYLYTLPETTVGDLAKELENLFKVETIRVVGDPQMKFTKASLVLGAPGPARQIESLQRDDVEVMIGGETHEWETVEYVRDAVSMGKKKALLLIGHANSEEAGMEYCADWLKDFITEVPIEFIPAGDPFWSPK